MTPSCLLTEMDSQMSFPSLTPRQRRWSLLTRFHPLLLPYKHQLLNFQSLCRLLLINPRKRRT